MVQDLWDYLCQWVLWQTHHAGFKSPLEWLGAILIAAHGCWLYFGTSWNEIWVQRIGTRNRLLRTERKWPRAWWHHPEDEWSPLLGHIFLVAMLFELWWLATRLHGRKLLRQKGEWRDNAAVPNWSNWDGEE